MSAYPPLSGLAPDLAAVRRLRDELDDRGLAPLTGLTAKAWERIAAEAGVPVETHRTSPVAYNPEEPAWEEAWGPEWLAVLCRAWSGPVPLHDLKPVVRRIAGDPDLQAALLAEEALRSPVSAASAILFELLGGYPALARAFGMKP